MPTKYMNRKQKRPIAPVQGRTQAAPDQDFMGTRPLVDEAANSNRSKRAAKTSGSGLGYKKGGKMPLPKPKPRHANPKHPMNTEKTKPLGKAAGGSMKIKSGDTLSQIAKKNNISLRDLLSANPSIKNANQIRVGQSIKLPKTKMTGSSIGATRNPYKGMTKKDMSDLDVKNKSAKRQQAVTSRSRVSAMDELKAKAKAPKALPKLGEANVDSEETKKQKASRTGSIKSATTAENKRLDEIRAKTRKLRNSKKASNTQVDVGVGEPYMNRVASLNNAVSKENRRLDEYREKIKRQADRRMDGGSMKKKVRAYKHGGSVCRGGGAATKGKRFGRSG